MTSWRLFLFLASIFSLPGVASAEDICADRPTKTNAACTVPEGHFQYETDLFNWQDSTNGNTYYFTNPTFKYGVNSRIDIELNVAPYEQVTGHDTPVLGGVSDTYARMKYNLFTTADGNAVTLLPYVKIPTAPPGIGNKAFEEGLIVPVVFNATGGFQVTLDPEVDVLKDPQSSGYYMNYQGLINVAHTIFTDRITLNGELWSDVNAYPSGVVTQWSLDTAVQWLVTPGIQLDIGANVGLNKATPILQSYIGISQIF